ncbi:MAG TPA: hypothetical protein VJ770_17135 [Stellaceae bacterium]|nr:hypothetical protein [Stellaceae bacterium]
MALLASCQPLPHPFADDAPKPGSPILRVEDGTSIWVAPVIGTPPAIAAKLAPALALALQDRQVAASERTAATNSEVLHGRIQETPVAPGEAAIVALWQLRDARGRFLGERAARLVGSAADWEEGRGDTVARLAATSADQLVSLVAGGAPPAEAKPRQTRLAIGPIQGAPGDGQEALARAIALMLKRPDLVLVAGPDAKPDLVLGAAVAVGQPKNGKQHVRIVWRLSRADGSEIGTVGQENDVPTGLLSGPWGNVAWSIAAAAQDGILELVAHSVPKGTPRTAAAKSGA